MAGSRYNDPSNPKTATPRLTLALIACVTARDAAAKTGDRRWGIKAIADKYGFPTASLSVLLSNYTKGGIRLNDSQQEMEKHRELDIVKENQRTDKLLLDALRVSNDSLARFVRCLGNGRLGIPDIERFRIAVVNLTEAQARIQKAMLKPGPKKTVLVASRVKDPVLLSAEETKLHHSHIHEQELHEALAREMAKLPLPISPPVSPPLPPQPKSAIQPTISDPDDPLSGL